jgi:hypothetical protein
MYFADGCRYGKLIISGGFSKKTFCGTNTPIPFMFNWNVVTLRMVTDGVRHHSGFDLKFNTDRSKHIFGVSSGARGKYCGGRLVLNWGGGEGGRCGG